MHRSTRLTLPAALLLGVCSAPAPASGVIINGQYLSSAQVQALEAQLGTRILPGNYLADPQSGCWMNLSNGNSGCLNRSGTTFSRYGSGERYGNGSWSHWSDLGGGVGGTADGCIYADGWSNC